MPINTSGRAVHRHQGPRRRPRWRSTRRKSSTASIAASAQAADNFLICSLPESKVEPTVQDQLRSGARQGGCSTKPAGRWAADGIRVKDGKPLKVKLWTQNDTEFKRLTEVVQAQLKAVGMDAEITMFDAQHDPRPVQEEQAPARRARLLLGQCRHYRLVLQRRAPWLSERLDVERCRSRGTGQEGDDQLENFGRARSRISRPITNTSCRSSCSRRSTSRCRTSATTRPPEAFPRRSIRGRVSGSRRSWTSKSSNYRLRQA